MVYVFAYPNSQFGYIFFSFGMENYVLCTLWPLGIFCGNLVFFPVLVSCSKKKSGNPVFFDDINTCINSRALANNTATW
jgi:hypothetical protein